MNINKKIISSILSIFILSLISCSEESLSDKNEVVNNTKEISTNFNYRYTDQEIIGQIAEDLNADIVYDSSVNEENAIVFSSEQEVRDFIAKIKNEAKKSEISAVEIDPELDKIYYASAMNTGWATLGFDVVTGANGCITSIDGGWSGMTLGLGYTQGGTSFGCHSGTVCGNVTFSIFFEGIGSVYSERVCYTITVP